MPNNRAWYRTTRPPVMPAEVGIHDLRSWHKNKSWIPAFAGMTRSQHRPQASCRTGRLLHRFDHLLLRGFQLRLDRCLDRAQPSQEYRLVLVDRHADRLCLLGAALAVILLG